jgi:uncharacterized protein YecT (DUF1311 family)
MRFATVLVALVCLAGCAQYDAERHANLAAAAQAWAAADDANCRSSGAQSGSPEYADCLQRFANQHAQETDRQHKLVDEMLNTRPIGPIGQ